MNDGRTCDVRVEDEYAPKDRPILFSAPMVNAILRGKKVVTRRVVRFHEQPPAELKWSWRNGLIEIVNREVGGVPVVVECVEFPCPYGVLGDRLWVRETFRFDGIDHRIGMRDRRTEAVQYRADEADEFVQWRPSIFMPRWASRITLEVMGVRIEQLQAITEEDARKEGFCDGAYEPGIGDGGKPGWTCDGVHYYGSARHAFEWRWDKLNANRGFGWLKNPWVWRVEFKRIYK